MPTIDELVDQKIAAAVKTLSDANAALKKQVDDYIASHPSTPPAPAPVPNPPPPPPPSPILEDPKISYTSLEVGSTFTRVPARCAAGYGGDAGWWFSSPDATVNENDQLLGQSATVVTSVPVGSFVRFRERIVGPNGFSETRWSPVVGPLTAVSVPPPAPAPTPVPAPVPVPSPTPAGFVTKQGTQMRLNGQLYRPVGFSDTSMLGHDGSPPSDAQIDEYFSRLKPGILIRVWFMQGMDMNRLGTMIRLAEKYGIKLMVTLGDSAGNPGSPNYDAAFFSGGFRGAFHTHVRSTVTMFANRPGVGIWQTMNETGLRGGPTTATAALFEGETAALIKSISPQNLVFAGIQDTYAGWSDSDAELRQILNHPAIDGYDFHSYEYHDVGNTGVPGRFPGDKAVCDSLGKIIILGEWAVGSKNVAVTPEQRASRIQQQLPVHKGMGAQASLYWRLIRPGQYADTGAVTGPAAREPWYGPVFNTLVQLSNALY